MDDCADFYTYNFEETIHVKQKGERITVYCFMNKITIDERTQECEDVIYEFKAIDSFRIHQIRFIGNTSSVN